MSDEPQFDWVVTKDGKKIRTARWQAIGPARGRVLLLQGRGEFIEKYLEMADGWRQRGYDVLSFDWRGQGCSSRQLEDKFKAHVDDFSEYMLDLEAVLDAYRQPQIGHNLIWGHSMGGHLAQRAVYEMDIKADALILCAPMMQINLAIPDGMAQKLAQMMVKFGMAHNIASGRNIPTSDKWPFIGNSVTHDKERYHDTENWCRNRPELDISGPSWGWLAAAFRSMNYVWNLTKEKFLRQPTLIISSKEDRLVVHEKHIEFAAEHEFSALKTYPDAKHEIYRELPHVRARMWQDIETFLTDNKIAFNPVQKKRGSNAAPHQKVG